MISLVVLIKKHLSMYKMHFHNYASRSKRQVHYDVGASTFQVRENIQI